MVRTIAGISRCLQILSIGALAIVLGPGGIGSAQDGGKKAWDPSLGTCEVKGKVTFDGKAPKRRPVDMGSEPSCSKLHSEAPLNESVVVNENGTLRNVFVWIKKGEALKGYTFAAPSEPVVLEQKGCTYVPHVLGAMVGQTLEVKNSDALPHNIHGQAEVNPSFNFTQAQEGKTNALTFKVPEVMIKIKCDIHGWMSSYLGVVKHPFFFTTGEDGAFTLPKLPAGKYTIQAWHEKYGTQDQEIELTGIEGKEVAFTFTDEKKK